MSQGKIIENIASQQHGIVTRTQLVNSGISPRQIYSLLKNSMLISISEGVYRTLGSQNTWHQKILATVFSCGHNAYLSHESVLMLFDLFPKVPRKIQRKRRPYWKRHLTHVVTDRSEYHSKSVFFHRSKCLTAADKCSSHIGIPHVTVERALVDCAQQLSMHELDYAIDAAITRGLTTVKKIKATVKNLHTGPGREKKKIKILLTPYLEKPQYIESESKLEKKVETIIKRSTSLELVKQYKVYLNNKNYRLDLAVPSRKIAIEVDGFAYHKSRTAFDQDRKRQNDLVMNGWKVIRITSAFTDEEIRMTFCNAVDP